jgi:hypothetical protein
MLKDRYLNKEEEQVAENFTDDEESEDEAAGKYWTPSFAFFAPFFFRETYPFIIGKTRTNSWR